MRRKNRMAAAVCATILASLSSIPESESAPGEIERVVILGLQRMTEGSARHALGVREGDPYDEDVLLRRFRAMYDIGVFEDLVFEVEDGPDGGKVLVVKVEERDVLVSVTYADNKVVNRTAIEDALREADVDLGLSKPLDEGAIADAEAVIRDLAARKGYLDAEVGHEIRYVTETSKSVHFSIRPGGKTRIRSIEFVGNEVFGDRRLKSQMQLTEERKWYWPWGQKSLYHPFKWDQDAGNVRDLYLNYGYLDVELAPPVVEFEERRKEPDYEKLRAKLEAAEATLDELQERSELASETWRELPPKKRRRAMSKSQKRIEKAQKRVDKFERKLQPKVKKWANLTVRVDEGQQYAMGEVTLRGNERFDTEELSRLISLRRGAMLSNVVLESSVEAIKRKYEDSGHLYATVTQQIERREGVPVADVTIAIDEDEPYYVEKIVFTGNSDTQDKVLRREVALLEGDLFNRSKLEISKIKINQLGYFEVPEEPIIEPLEGENRVRIRFAGQESDRNEIQVGGGYSGFDGAFFQGVYSTRNFLGRGQVLSTAIQVGGRASRYQLSFQEPWFLGRPLLLGFSVFRSDIDFGSDLQSTSQGGGIVLGKRIGFFSSIRLAYDFRDVESTSLGLARDEDGNLTTVDTTAENRISSITPTFTYNTVNNPYRPSGGQRFSIATQIAGGPLGGDTSVLKPFLQYTRYQRFRGRPFFLAFNAEAGIVREWADGTTDNSANINGVPRFLRYWLGGELQGPRVFDTRTITPLRYVLLNEDGSVREVINDPTGLPAGDFINAGGVPVRIQVGGDRFYLLQSEFVRPLNQQAELAFFLDVGDSLFEDQALSLSTARVSAGVELRFYLPVFPVPLRLIYGWPIRELPSDRSSSFAFSIGRSF